jgi:hypothetical protein
VAYNHENVGLSAVRVHRIELRGGFPDHPR